MPEAFARASISCRRRVVGQVQRHQRRESQSRRDGGENALAVGGGLRGRRHRRLQVGHDDGAGKLPRRVRHHGRQRRAVAQVQVPVVGAGKRERLHARIIRG
jgi:hypothetical protein